MGLLSGFGFCILENFIRKYIYILQGDTYWNYPNTQIGRICSQQLGVLIPCHACRSFARALTNYLEFSSEYQAVGHGLSSSFLDKVREVGKQFFALPVEEKEKYSRATDGIEGYGNDPILSENQVLDWSYRLFLRLQPVDQRKLRLWPENPTEFRYLYEQC